MRIPLLLIFLAVPTTSVAAEQCFVMKKGANGYESVEEPCESFDRKLPCTERIDYKGGTIFQDVPCAPGQQKTMRQVEEEENAAKRKACGKDYGKLKVGMTLDRFEQCTEALVFVTDRVDGAGVLEIYRSTFYVIESRDGRIVAFSRRVR